MKKLLAFVRILTYSYVFVRIKHHFELLRTGGAASIAKTNSPRDEDQRENVSGTDSHKYDEFSFSRPGKGPAEKSMCVCGCVCLCLTKLAMPLTLF